jgi:tRNA-dihydrouridine synthase A
VPHTTSRRSQKQKQPKKEMSLSIAPMIGWTDRNYRFLIRQITRETLLYTEMVMDKAIVYNNNEKLVDYIGYNNQVEPPLALQLGGNDPERLGEAVSIAEQYGQFAEINLNNGCPSNKAKKAGFGAELMLEPELVRQIVHTMNRRASRTEITVKCRIGVQGKKESFEELVHYIEACKAGGSRKIIVHSRVCVLSGLTPAQNRTIPPLRYDVVYRLIDHFPELQFVLNGGVKSLGEVDRHLRGVGLGCQHERIGKEVESIEQMSVPLQEETHTQQYCLDYLSRHHNSVSSQFVPLWSVSLGQRLTNSVTSASYSKDTSISMYHDSVNAVVRGGYCYRVPCHAERTASSTNSDLLSDMSYTESSQDQPCMAGVMIGREAYNNPWSLANADKHFFNKSNPSLSRREVLQHYCDYTAEAQNNSDHAKNSAAVLCKPLHNFFYGCSTNKQFKQKFDNLIKLKTEKKESTTKLKKVHTSF